MPQFNNTENEAVNLPDGRRVWLSRSCAVVVNVWYIGPDMKPLVLMGKRGPGTPDEQGKWVLPCGYLDYDETLAQAALREVFEETGVDITAIRNDGEHFTLWDNINTTGRPYYVNSVPSDDKKQNITHYFGFIFSGGDLPELSTEHCEPGEVAELRWVPFDEVGDYDIGFNHLVRIKEFAGMRNKSFEII